jgi:alpha-D-glucose phosphate-specific phosphoglucomutase
MSGIAFGTSGWRGIMAEDFTFTAVRAASQAIAEHIRDLGREASARGVVIGYDTRFLSEAFAAQVARVLAANEVKALLCVRDTPTPVVSHEILRRKAAGGIVITASHNPPEYNGIKLSSAWGGPALPEVTRRIQARANALVVEPVAQVSAGDAEHRGLLERIDPAPAYLDRLRALVDFQVIREARMKVVVDPLYGTAQGYLDRLLKAAGCEVLTVHAWRDPNFGGRSPEPAEEQLKELAFQVVETGSHLGVATDGDGDRFGLIDADGAFLEPNYFLALLLRHLVKTRGWTGAAARSVATSHLVDAVARHLHIPVHETPVGFKYIGELISKDAVVLGGEESAGLSVKGHVPEKDGILACLLAVELVASRGCPRLHSLLHELYSEVGRFLVRRRNYRLSPEAVQRVQERLRTAPGSVADLAVVDVKRLDGVKLILEDGSWILLRLSGTEPMVRLYVEAATPERLEQLTEAGEAMIKQ